MNFILILALATVGFTQQIPSASYGAPNGFNGANGNGGAPSRFYGAPNGGSQDPEIVSLTESIPGGGIPGEDYPVLAAVPETGFSCDDQDVPGYYADTASDAGCQVFHICQDRPSGRRQQDSFLCPNGTIFNQQYLVCDWWFNFDCDNAEDFYSVNELIGVDPKVGYGYGTGNGNGNGRNKPNGSNKNGNGRNNGYGNGGPSNTYTAPV